VRILGKISSFAITEKEYKYIYKYKYKNSNTNTGEKERRSISEDPWEDLELHRPSETGRAGQAGRLEIGKNW